VILLDADARNRWRWNPEFVPAEFECRHCHALKVEEAFMDRLLRARQELGEPMPISSGYRCPYHNARVSKTGESGPHTTGHAADVAIFGAPAFRLAMVIAPALGFTGIGIHQHGDHQARLIHLDDLPSGPDCPRPRVWSYQ
jgi:zinc D-Ala-D-Ala carboxypeptidase